MYIGSPIEKHIVKNIANITYIDEKTLFFTSFTPFFKFYHKDYEITIKFAKTQNAPQNSNDFEVHFKVFFFIKI